MVSVSSASSSSAPYQPLVAIEGIASPPQGGKRYLRDYPDADKTRDPKYPYRTFLKDPQGFNLEIPDAIQDTLVIEDPSEPRLQQLARKYVQISNRDTYEKFCFRKRIVEEFGEEATHAAIDAAFAEESALHSPEARELTRQFLAVKGIS